MWNLSKEEKNTASNQTIPSLRQLLKLAQENNISVIFDLYSPDKENDTEDVVDVILDSGIDPSLVGLISNPCDWLWLRYTVIIGCTFTFYRSSGFLQQNGNTLRRLPQASSTSTTTVKYLRRTMETTWMWNTAGVWRKSGMKNKSDTKSTHTTSVVVLEGMHSSVLIRSVRTACWDTALAIKMQAQFCPPGDDTQVTFQHKSV